MAGLAAAVELARAGSRPLLVESRPFVGGRVRSFVHAATGDEIDNGQHLMMGCYRDTLRLLELLGTRHLVTVQRRLHVEFRDADGAADRLLAVSLLPSPLDVLAGMLRLRRLSARERLGLVRVALAARRRERSVETVTELLTRLGQRRNARERLWNPIVIATLNTHPDVASAELFLEVMRRAFLGRGDDSRLVIPRVGLSQLLEPSIEYITARGGSVELGTSVTRIVERGEVYTVEFKDRPPIEAPRVIVAVPPRSASSLLGSILEQVAPVGEALELSPIVSLYLWYDRPLSRLPAMTALLGTRVQWVFNRRRLIDGEESAGTGLLSCTISAADIESATNGDEVIRLADTELRRAFAELDGARLVDALVVKEKHATFRAGVGIDSLRPPTSTERDGLFLAGDWTATGLPATIEGAAQSGFAAAAALLAEVRQQPAAG